MTSNTDIENCIFQFTINDIPIESYCTQTGTIKYGGLKLQICPSYNGDEPIKHVINNIEKMVNGEHLPTNTVELNINDGYTAFYISNDTFTLNWGYCYDTVCDSTLRCSYSKNKTNIDNFLIYMIHEFTILYNTQFYNTYIHYLIQKLKTLKQNNSIETNIIAELLMNSNVNPGYLDLFKNNETHSQFIHTLISYMISDNNNDILYMKEVLQIFNLPVLFVDTLFKYINNNFNLNNSQNTLLFCSK